MKICGSRPLLTTLILILAAYLIGHSRPAFAKPDKGISTEHLAQSCHVDVAKMREMLEKFELPGYFPETFDCDDFANTFLKLCRDIGLKVYRLSFKCRGMDSGHALNVVCHGTTCCVAEPQALSASSRSELLGGCWFSENGDAQSGSIPERVQRQLCEDQRAGPEILRLRITEGPTVDKWEVIPAQCAQKTYTQGSYRSSEMLSTCRKCCQREVNRDSDFKGPWENECYAHCGSFPSELHPIRCAERTYGAKGDAPDEKKEQCMKCCAQDSKSENIAKEYRDEWQTHCQDSCGSVPADYCSTRKTIASVDFPVECASCCSVLSSKTDQEGCYTQCATKTECFTDKKILASYDACEACCDGIYQVNYRDKSSAQFERWKEYNGPRKDSRLACWSACAAKTIRHSDADRQ